MKTRALLASLLLLAPLCRADDLTFAFAIPEFDGRVSLGVFDDKGKLVRVLYQQAPEEDFTAGLDGLLARWDKKNEAGEPVPAGHYTVHGYFVGEKVASEGVAFHFNDWVESEETPAAVVTQVIGSSSEQLFLGGLRPQASTNESLALGYSGEKLTVLGPLPAGAVFLGSDPRQAILYAPGDTGFFSFDYADPAKSQTLGKTWSNAGGAVFGSPAHPSHPTAWPQVQPPQAFDSPENFGLMDANGAGLVASDRHLVWVRRHELLELVPVEADLTISTLSAGVGETFWILAQKEIGGVKGPKFARQYSFAGEILRQLTDAFDATSLLADQQKDILYLASRDAAGGTTIRGLRPLAAAQAKEGDPVDWEIFLEKSSALCPQFGFVDGKLVPDAKGAPQAASVSVSLDESSFQKAGVQLPVLAQTRRDTVWLQDKDGIPLFPVSTLPGASRTLLSEEKNGSIHVFVGNGSVVAEYEVTGLNQIAPIDGGDADVQ